MPPASFFEKLGIFMMPGFLDSSTCSQLREEASVATHENLSVVDGASFQKRVKPEVRKTKCADISTATEFNIHRQLASVRARLENHFHLDLQDCERPQVLVYDIGDYFRPHTDSDTAYEKPDYVKRRKISVTVCLNGNDSEAESQKLVGGSLTLYGLIPNPRWENYGFTVENEAGLLIAFPSGIVHEVTPVVRGRRFSIVSWFF